MTTVTAGLPVPFDLYGELPTGTTVLEASAGTGKTFTIAGLVTRYVAEGIAVMDELLVVSFSRESTRELRERVRERLVSARDGLTAHSQAGAGTGSAAGSGLPGADGGEAGSGSGDRLLDHLASGTPAERELRRHRLEQALASFDGATVTTTHGFCQQVLQALGTAGDHDPGAILVENIADLAREVADDLYLRKWGAPGAEPAAMKREDFHALALEVVNDPATSLLPAVDARDDPGLRRRIATAVLDEVIRRKWRLHIIDYDDMLVRLEDLLKDPQLGPAACERLRSRYRIVLVDEFQDTDPVQWNILRLAFHQRRTMVLIGDPKQSIYGFRGADVHSYLEAAADAGTTRTLTTSYRSDAALMTGLDAVFAGAALGDPRIRVVPVEAVHPGRMVVTGGAPVRLRVVPRGGFQLTPAGLPAVGPVRETVARDVAAQAVELLAGQARLHPRDGSPVRPVQPGDIAVLVRTNAQAQLVSDELLAAGVPAVMTGRRSVFLTVAAKEWQLLLEAMEQPHRVTRVRRLALSCFVGMTATQLAAADDATDGLALVLRQWTRTLEERGVAALFEAVSLSESVLPRVLAQESGERLLTDLRHVGQALHEAGLRGQLGLTALLTWLRRHREDAARDGGLERSRRLESDAAAVQVITVHTSKGLEFPVTMVPFAWDLYVHGKPATTVFHDDSGQRRRDVGGPGPGWTDHLARHFREEVDGELRLTYVAMTRAQSNLLLWWAPSSNTKQAALHRLLLHDDPSTVAPTSMPVPADAAAFAAFSARAASSNGGLAVEVMQEQPQQRWAPPAADRQVLGVAWLGRDLDVDWRRTSYSSLTAAAHDEPRLGSEPEITQRDDETDLDDVTVAGAAAEPGTAGGAGPAGPPGAAVPIPPDERLREAASGWDSLPSGADFGTLVHSVLETLPGAASQDAVRAAVAGQAARGGPGADLGVLAAGLSTALATPLGALAGGISLHDLATRDRLAELDFELPLGGGDDPAPTRQVLTDLVPLWRTHNGHGPLAGYADALATLDPAPLRGYLTGSIDAVLRIGDGSDLRYLVVDYKTNRLGGYDEPLTAWHYRQAAMERAMIEAHYPLQALLYDVALHRYLRWRQPGYSPEQHLGGALYLFLRGMSGPGVLCDDGSVPGVFAWRPPAALVVATSDLLAGIASGVPVRPRPAPDAAAADEQAGAR